MSELSGLMTNLPYTLFVTAIKKIPYVEKYGNNAKNPYDIALEYSFERVLNFMEKERGNCLPVIAEARGKNEDNELRASFYHLTTQGTTYNSGERFQKLICPLSFHDKRQNIAGIQLADLCAHPSARHVMKPHENNLAFEAIRSHFYTNGGVSGLKVFPQ